MDQSGQTPSCPAAQAIHHEWRTAENSAAYLQAKLQSMKETNPHLTLLDVGAGSGTISVTLAKAITDGQVTAIDLNEDILPRARAVAESAGVKNIKFQQADAHNLPFPDGTFDITHCHQVLYQMKAPWEVLREMVRVTKPGGVVAAREGDFETECIWPEIPGLLRFHKFTADVIKAAGGSPTGGRQLLSWALSAGVRRNQVTASYGTWYYSTPADKSVWAQAMVKQVREGRLRKTGLEAGLVTENDLEEFAKAWEEWEEAEDASLGMMHGEILIQN